MDTVTNRPRRVLIFSFSYFPDLIGGAEIAVKEITNKISSQEVVFDMIALRGGMNAEETIGNVHIYRVGWRQKNLRGFKGYIAKLAYIPLALFKAITLQRKHGYDAIWSIMANFSSAPWLFFSYVYPRIPRLLTLQEGDPVQHIKRRVRLVYPIFRQVFVRATRIQVISKYLADVARNFGARSPIEVVPNGVDLSHFTKEYTRDELEPLFNKLNKRPSDIFLITTSRLVEKNGITDIIAALEFLPKHVKLVIAGQGPLEKMIKQQARDLMERDSGGVVLDGEEAESRVIFVGHISHQELPQYLKVCDIFVRPSLSEGMGNSFIEAMAARLPVIATPVGGIVDFVHDGETGLLAEPQNPRSIAQKVEKILKDNESRDYIVRTAYDMVMQKYDWSAIATSMREKVFAPLFSTSMNPKNRKPRILIATGIFPPEIGGPATYAYLLSQELPKRGYEIHVLPFREVRHHSKWIRHLVYFWKVFCASFRSDIIFTQDPISTGFPVVCAGFFGRKKVVMRIAGDQAWEQARQFHGVTDSVDDFQEREYSFKVELMRMIQRFSVRHADIVLTPSNYFTQLVSGWNDDTKKIITIYNGIDISLPITHERKYSEPTIFSAGRLVPWKGFDTLIEALVQLPDWRLKIAGEGADKERLLQIAVDKGVSERVEFLGQLSRTELFSKIQQSHIFALLSTFESFSFQVVESLHLGVPVIATNCGNLSEIIEHGKNGILIDPKNIDGFVEYAEMIHSNKVYATNLSKNGKIRAKDFSIERTLNSLCKIFDSLL